MASKQPKADFFIVHFPIHSTTRLRGHNPQISQVLRTVRQWISSCAPTMHWNCDTRMQNWQSKSPPALWKSLPNECLRVNVALNGNKASMFLELAKNKLNQLLVIEKRMNKCIFFQIFWYHNNINENNRKPNFRKSNSYTRANSYLVVAKITLLTRSTYVIVDARSHTCKSHYFIPRYDMITFKERVYGRSCLIILYV